MQLLLVVKATITQITRLTHDVKSFHLHIPGRSDYKPGQFLVLTLPIDGKMVKRAYSLASSPHWENVEIVVKLNPAGMLTPKLFDKCKTDQCVFGLHEGEQVEVALPYGLFTLPKILPEKLVFLGGGAGLSPLLSMMRYLENIHYKGEVVFIYGNRTPKDIPYKDEIDRLANSSLNMNVLHVVNTKEDLPWDGPTGFITEELIKEHTDTHRSYYYICGPPQMVVHMVQNLEHLGVDAKHICREQW